MQKFRRLINRRSLPLLLLLTLALRSFVASGFMLDTEPADGSLLSIKLCDGPAGIYSINDDTAKHHQHHHHQDHEDHSQHDGWSKNHGFSACSFWSASGQGVLASLDLPDFNTDFINEKPVTNKNLSQHPSSLRLQFARAPPRSPV